MQARPLQNDRRRLTSAVDLTLPCFGSLCSMAYQQTPTRANIEFLKSSKGCGGRVIRLAGASDPQLIPQQLQGRMDPVSLALEKAAS